jgi:hypothetical protein
MGPPLLIPMGLDGPTTINIQWDWTGPLVLVGWMGHPLFMPLGVCQLIEGTQSEITGNNNLQALEMFIKQLNGIIVIMIDQFTIVIAWIDSNNSQLHYNFIV